MSTLDFLLRASPILILGSYIAWRAIKLKPSKFKLSDFFLARGDIGGRKTRANSLNNNFALANILWLFITFGYFFGPIAALAIEIPWVLSLAFVGRIAPVIVKSARKGNTLHGFLGESYGSKPLRKTSAIVTATGYLLNFGFELYISGIIISLALGIDLSYRWLIAGLLAIISASYISLCGFLGNVSQDERQNFIGLSATLLFAGIVTYSVFVTPASGVDLEFSDPAYWGLSLWAGLGFLAYTSVFNIVDVSNWQGVAANMKLDDSVIEKEQPKSWLQAGIGAWLFAAIGAFLGYLLRSIPNLEGDDLFPTLLGQVFPDGGLLQSFVLGLIAGGFFILALGYGENLLSAAQLTLMADVFKSDEYDALARMEDSDELIDLEDRFVQKSQRSTFLIVIVALASFYFAILSIGEQTVLDFMFIIFGSAISMFPSLIFVVRHRLKGSDLKFEHIKIPAIVSVVVGYLVALVPVFYPVISSEASWDWVAGQRTAEIAPLLTITLSFVVFHGGRLLVGGKSDSETRT